MWHEFNGRENCFVLNRHQCSDISVEVVTLVRSVVISREIDVPNCELFFLIEIGAGDDFEEWILTDKDVTRYALVWNDKSKLYIGAERTPNLSPADREQLVLMIRSFMDRQAS